MPRNGTNVPARLEAFSDGVFAIAITLLSLELKVPHEPGTRLIVSLTRLWPEFLAFALSFVTVGVIWLNHHALFTRICRIDNGVLLLNGLLLMVVAVVPFSNALLAEYLGHPGQRTAAMVYSGTFVIVSLLFFLLWQHAMTPRRQLVDATLEPWLLRRIGREYAFGLVTYTLSFFVATASAAASVVIDVLLAAFFAFPAVDVEARHEQRRAEA